MIRGLAVVAITLWAIFMTVRNRQLRRIIDGIDNPEVHLTRGERRARAKQKLQRLDDEELDRRYHEMVNGRNNTA